MTNQSVLIFTLLLALAVAPERMHVFAGEFLDLREVATNVEHNPAFSEFPLTVECRIKLAPSDNYNIIIANETKASATHWELFSMPETGYFTLYAPGFAPDHVYTEKNIADDQFHDVAAVIAETYIALYVDSEEIVKTKVKAPQKKASTDNLGIGRLVEGGMNCNGEIAEIRISKGVRKIAAETPMQPDKDTIAFWRFDENANSETEPGLYTDLSGNGNHVIVAEPVAQGIVEGKNINAAFLPLPEPKDTNPAKLAAQKIIADLKLETTKTGDLRDTIWQEWLYDFENWNKIEYSDKRGIWFDNRKAIPEQVFDRHSLVWHEDGGPAGTAIRRTEALLKHLADTHENLDLNRQAVDLAKLKQAYFKANLTENDPAQLGFYMACCVIRRQIAFQNPLLDFDDMLCVVRGTYAGSIRSNSGTMDMQGGHFVNQYFGFNAIPGGGLYIVKNWKGNASPEVTNLLEDSVVQNGRFRGQKLNRGAFCTPDVDFDGKRISFSWSANTNHKLIFSRDRLWNIFTVNSDGTNLTQLTDEAYDDFDSCWLPNGRLAFISERRGGFIRCFSGLRVPQYSLFSMKDDGSDIIPLSYYETSEWNPTVNHDGKIVYTRWDYTDRENCIGSRYWVCGPDGTDPRAPHGNYPHPWHTFNDHPNMRYDSRMGAPRTETSIRAVPGSTLYMFTAAPHHGDIDGTLCMLDLSIPDDGHMSQIKRITPEELFPESEFTMRSHFKYKTPWPLNEDYYIVNCWENLVLFDRFGNKELICHLREMPCKHDDRFRVFEPIPLRPRERPPILPTLTNQGEDAIAADDPAAPKATLAVMNVYESDQPLPEGVKIKWLRVVQNILKSEPEMGVPMIGYERENTPRIPLGIVPVEEDGSAYFEAPVAKELIFQILDENKMAVQSMRSVAYVHPGEQLRCTGCHENNWFVSSSMPKMPLAMQREPSKLEPELNPIEPVSYYRQIKPIFEKHCIDCHKQENAGPTDMSYEALKEEYTFWFSGGMLGATNTEYSGVHGGSRSIPGRFGTRDCKIGQAMLDDTHRDVVPDDVKRVVNLWLDCNSLRLTAFHRVGEQLEGKLVWPYLDVDPRNPVGVEGTEPRLQKMFWHQNLEGPHPFLCSSHQENKVFLIDRNGKIRWQNPAQNPQDSWGLENGNVLVACLHRVYEIAPDIASGQGGRIVWEYATQAPNEIPTCQPLPDGNVLIGIVGECRLIELNRQGKIVHEVKLDTSVKEPHAQFRLCRKTPEGTYLVPFTAEGAVREYNAQGEVIREFPKIASPVGVVRLPDGNTLISGGGKVTEYTPDNRIVWEIGQNDIPDIAIGTLAGLQRLENGNTIVCNWGTSPKGGKVAAHIFEISYDKYVVWQVERTDIGRTASCQILTDDFKPIRMLKTWR